MAKVCSGSNFKVPKKRVHFTFLARPNRFWSNSSVPDRSSLAQWNEREREREREGEWVRKREVRSNQSINLPLSMTHFHAKIHQKVCQESTLRVFFRASDAAASSSFLLRRKSVSSHFIFIRFSDKTDVKIFTRTDSSDLSRARSCDVLTWAGAEKSKNGIFF